MSEEAFREEVAKAIDLYEQASKYPATRTRKMIADLGEIGALTRLMQNPDLQVGFRVLRDNQQLDKTFEAVVVRFHHLFNSDTVQVAQWRLDNADKLL